MVPILRQLLIVACGLAAVTVLLRAPEVLRDIRIERAATARYQYGLQLQTRGRLDEAATEFRAAVSLRPSARAPLIALAEVEFRREHFEEAVGLYHRLADKYPSAYIGAFHRGAGLAQLRLGRFVEARDDLRRAVEYDPADWFAHYLLGVVALRLGSTAEARAAWARTLKLNPTFRPAQDRLKWLNEGQ